ncbi:unnamed protein product [Zymoseptoria tritici ST99CH_1E4]|uniref:Uncharacterized protein n=1 Tax=Zymoseptoria tritici ST99CH_1E4 TaxID=1276532 RepID=A0A2H1FIZ8_ZYMTR|nr:unnamed protein product [Zymoseptoria tritici ST99CH_1E4]
MNLPTLRKPTFKSPRFSTTKARRNVSLSATTTTTTPAAAAILLTNTDLISNLSTAANSTMCVILWTRCGRRWCENAGYFTSPVVLSGCALRQRGTPHDACPAHREVHEEGDCRACVERRELEHLRVRAAAAAALQRALDAQLGQ